jgi:Fur family ferric uptake transcriptional regulator
MLDRKTPISTHVIKILEASQLPLSVAHIMAQLDTKGLTPNKTTIYRLLEKLITKKAVSEIFLRNGTTYYELSKGHHHHHFICNECDTVFCLESCHVESHAINLAQLLPNKGFKIQSHDFNLYGVCEPCLQH